MPTSSRAQLPAGEVEEDVLEGAPVDLADGYIHLSTAAQLTETVDKHFAGQSDLWVAAIDLEALGDAVTWEESRGGALFPHIYGALNRDAIVAVVPVLRAADGAFLAPVLGPQER